MLIESLERRRLLAGDGLPPTAIAITHPQVADGGHYWYTFDVEYRDADRVNMASVESNRAILVTRSPDKYRQLAKKFYIHQLNDDAPLVVTYGITAPGGTWSADDIGTYKVSTVAGRVLDVAGNAMPAIKIGSFRVVTAAPALPLAAKTYASVGRLEQGSVEQILDWLV